MSLNKVTKRGMKKMRVTEKNDYDVYGLAGLSTETPPTSFPVTIGGIEIKHIASGSTYLETDTQNMKFYNEESNEWK